MFIERRHALVTKAPEGRHVIRKTGRGIRRGWVSQPIGRGHPAPTIADTSVTGDSILPLAPEGRHVYRTATCPSNQSPRGATCDTENGRWNP